MDVWGVVGGCFGVGWEGSEGGQKMSNIVLFKNVWEYFSRVGGIKIRGLGMLLDQQKQKIEFGDVWYFGVGGMGGAL